VVGVWGKSGPKDRPRSKGASGEGAARTDGIYLREIRGVRGKMRGDTICQKRGGIAQSRPGCGGESEHTWRGYNRGTKERADLSL